MKRFRKMEELAVKPLAEYTYEEYDKLWKKEFGKELFSRFSRRQYLNRLTNDDHNKNTENLLETYGDRIPIEIYRNRKKAGWCGRFILSLYARYKLIRWRKKHPLR